MARGMMGIAREDDMDEKSAPPMTQMRLLITGAGSGFGAAIARVWAGPGVWIAITDIDPERAAATLAGVRACGGDGIWLKLDVKSDADWAAAKDAVLGTAGGLDVLVNNAGVAAGGDLADTPLADWQWIVDIDLLGVVRGCRAMLPLLRASRRGHVVNMASFAGLAGAPGIAAYGAAKAAVVALSEQLRVEESARGVEVSVVCPAFVKTRLLDTFRSPYAGDRQRVARWMARAPVSAEDVALAVRRAVERRRFLVLTHRETRWLWRLKRWFPELYFRFLRRMSGRRGTVSKCRVPDDCIDSKRHALFVGREAMRDLIDDLWSQPL